MTEVLAIVVFGVLFVLFGLLHKGRSQERAGCDTCSTPKNTATCGDCQFVSETSEQNHA